MDPNFKILGLAILVAALPCSFGPGDRCSKRARSFDGWGPLASFSSLLEPALAPVEPVAADLASVGQRSDHCSSVR